MMWEVMSAFVIIHNMIAKNERYNSIYDQIWEFQGELVAPEPGPPTTFEDFLAMQHEIRDHVSHNQLQTYLVVHM
jgi:hypothetical protein